MFWVEFDAFLITLILAFIGVAAAVYFAPKFNRSRLKIFFLSVLLAIVLAVPTCGVAISLMSYFRFGAYEYDAQADIYDYKVSQFIPSEASNIREPLKNYSNLLK